MKGFVRYKTSWIILKKPQCDSRIVNAALGVLLIVAVFLLFTAALNSEIQSTLQASSYSDSPCYDSVPIAFTVSFDLQRIKRVAGESYRVTLPVRYTVVSHIPGNTEPSESFAPYFVSLPLLVASPKSFRQSCLVVDLPPPSF
ncbi:MAG: hypothetical protein PHR56_04665 [Dehalococcoidales bacterium]|nr:hypothetical protein [Dehalococcoidales bacterium]